MDSSIVPNRSFALTKFATCASDKAAAINGSTGETLTYRELNARSNKFARFMHAMGLRPGDHIAVLMENNLRFFEILWGAMRSGILITPVNRYSTPDEAAYVIQNCDAKLVVFSHAMREVAEQLQGQLGNCRKLMIGDVLEDWESYETALSSFSEDPVADERLGAIMLYSSGTTGRPKGILREQPVMEAADGPVDVWRKLAERYFFSNETVFLTGAPLYHGAPLLYSLNVQFHGGTVIFMEKFDALTSLAMIERYRVTHSLWVPTMFVRMLKLAPAEREGFDLCSHQCAIHAAGPCSREVKQQMIDWWGPIIEEFYGGSEGCGNTAISSREWMDHPGSVGRATVGVLRICSEQGELLPPHQDGLVYFERDVRPFEYYKDPEKTRSAQHPQHENWTTIGDIGHIDEEGYLYLTDRLAYTIISGGVNIYPRAIEDALIQHPSVGDAAVIGVPNAEMGEEVKAIVELARGVQSSSSLADELLQFVRGKVSRYMVPKSIEFTSQLPRSQYGKMDKKALKDVYGRS
ncbi:acyl-CoA synthetase [Hydrogenophaga sp. BPS33]|uniref:acyl-CoA synthetase n=1 Tax=Hydrogenophaga sp. BPS33 TaxID=2651974 RepID=UPI00131F79CA|nr:acyl-CoA synthetase [Hydrogenophaga sp. BPS33]QHE83392.1 acyl-CoA synthetase [Hydrogenophaga sp. BPS33]